MSEAEKLARTKEARQRDAIAERWQSGYQTLMETRLRRHTTSPFLEHTGRSVLADDSLHESAMTTADHAPLVDNQSISTSPPYSPPGLPLMSMEYPLESSAYPRRKDITRSNSAEPAVRPPRSGSGRDVSEISSPEPRAQAGLTIHWNQDDSLPSKVTETENTVHGEDLMKMMRRLRSALKNDPSLDITVEDASLRNIRRLIEARDGPSGEATLWRTPTDAQEWQLDKISVEDGHYAQRLNDIRGRLGSLVTKLHDAEAPVNEQTPSSKLRAWSVPSAGYQDAAMMALRLAVALLCITLLALHWLRLRAEYLYQSVYYDPLQPTIFPLPRYVHTFLSPWVDRNTPFALAGPDSWSEYM